MDSMRSEVAKAGHAELRAWLLAAAPQVQDLSMDAAKEWLDACKALPGFFPSWTSRQVRLRCAAEWHAERLTAWLTCRKAPSKQAATPGPARTAAEDSAQHEAAEQPFLLSAAGSSSQEEFSFVLDALTVTVGGSSSGVLVVHPAPGDL